MRVAHTLSPAPVGGLETVVQTLSSAQAASGLGVHVIVVLDDDSVAAPWRALTSKGVFVHEIFAPGRRYRYERAQLRRLIAEISPDVVHTHGYRSAVLHGAVGRSLRVPLVSTVHGFTGGGAKNLVYELLQRLALRRYDGVIAVSDKLGIELRRQVSAQRVHVIRNAWAPSTPALSREEARRALSVDGNGFVIGWIGRLSREKGADVFLAALPHVDDLPLRASILGVGAESAALNGLARELHVADRLTWHGIVPDAGRLLSAFDVVVLSSRTEGTPMVVYEALHAGTPLIATDVGGVREIVSAKEAFLVAAKAPEAIARAIRQIYDDPAEAQRRADAGQHRLRSEFGLNEWVARHAAVYAGVQKGRRN